MNPGPAGADSDHIAFHLHNAQNKRQFPHPRHLPYEGCPELAGAARPWPNNLLIPILVSHQR